MECFESIYAAPLRNIESMKKRALPIIFLIVFAAFALIHPQSAHAAPSVAYSAQSGTIVFHVTNQIANIVIQTTSSTQIILVWVLAGGTSNNDDPVSINDNQSNFWSLATYGGGTTTQCAYSYTSCVFGTTISNPVSAVGHDAIQITFTGTGFRVALAAYDVAGGVYAYGTHGTGNSNLGSTTNLATSSFVPGANAIALTSAFVTGATANTFTAGAGYTLASGQGTYPSGAYYATSEFDITAAATTAPETSTSNQGWFEAGVAWVAGTGVTQAITLNVANLGPSAMASVSGCLVSNSTFSADGYKHTYTNLYPSCTVTVTAPSSPPPPPPEINPFRYVFNDAGNPISTWAII